MTTPHTQFTGDWDRDLAEDATIEAGQLIAKNGASMTAREAVTRGTSGNWDHHNERFLRNSYPFVPRNFAAMAHGARGSSGRGSRAYRYQRPRGTASRQVPVHMTPGRPGAMRFDWDTDVRLYLPPDEPYRGDISIIDARSVTVIGGELTAQGASPNTGGSFVCKGIRDFVWAQGLRLNLIGRGAEHDAFNLCGKSRGGSDGGHVVGDFSGGYPAEDYAGRPLSRYTDDPDFTRYSHPDLYLVDSRVDGVSGSARGIHGDMVQLQGPVGSIYIDLFTGTSQYQGLQLQPAQGITGVICLSRMNLMGYSLVGDPEGAIMLWLASGSANRELPPTVLDQVFVGPAYDAGGRSITPYGLLHPNETFHEAARTREGLPIGFRDMGYVTSPEFAWNVTAKRDVFTTFRWNDDGLSTSTIAHGLEDGERVVFSRSSDATRPGSTVNGIRWETMAYYVVNATDETFQVALDSNGFPISVADFGPNSATYLNRRRLYVAPALSMPYQGFVYEGLPTDKDWVGASDCGVGYVDPGSQWD